MKDAHFIAIFGGAVAGSEAAAELARRGIHVVVFDQNALPYGKLEAGLPKWHDKLRDRQEQMINEKLQHPLISFAPMIKLGRNMDFQEFLRGWNFSAVLIATGAWRDRPLPVAGIDEYVGKGFYYQNPFVHWFNHNHDHNYKGEPLEISDSVLIIGGGLASLDVAKIVMIETTRQALEQRGIEVDALTLERKGVVEVLSDHGLSMETLGLKDCTLVTRAGIGEMPLTVIPNDATPEDIEKARQTRQKILSKAQEKFPFKVIGHRQAKEVIIENGRVAGMIFSVTKSDEDQSVSMAGTVEKVRAPLVISAIGSIPEKIPGIPMKGEIYDVEDVNTGKIRDFDNVFAVGNAVTGRGNIRQSQLHSRQVSETIVDQYLAWQEEDYKEIFDSVEQRVEKRVGTIAEQLLRQKKPLAGDIVEQLYGRIKELQKQAGYHGDYKRWIAGHLPTRLEDMAERKHGGQ